MEAKMDGLKRYIHGLNKNFEANMDGFKNGMEAGMESKMDDMEAKIDEKMENMKNDLKENMEGLTNLIQEMFPNGEKVGEENHAEKKIHVNHDFINPNVGWKTHHIPKIDMRKFDGNDPVTWILHMEQYCDLNNVKNTQKLCISTLYLEKNTFVWYRWLCSRKKIATWSIFTKEMIAHYEDTKRNNFFFQLINLKQKGSLVKTLFPYTTLFRSP